MYTITYHISWDSTVSIIDSLLKYMSTDLEYPGHCIPQALAEHDAVKADFKADITEAVKDAF